MKTAIAALGALAMLTGCSGLDDCNKLGGAVAITYDLGFNKVTIEKQTKAGQFQAMRVTYLNDDSGDIPVRLVANAPVEEGKKKDLATKEATVYRVMQNNSQFPDVKEGHITFDTLGGAGDDADGRFYATFVDGTTLNGEFCGTVRELTN
jgi:hypothetical protein